MTLIAKRAIPHAAVAAHIQADILEFFRTAPPSAVEIEAFCQLKDELRLHQALVALAVSREIVLAGISADGDVLFKAAPPEDGAC